MRFLPADLTIDAAIRRKEGTLKTRSGNRKLLCGRSQYSRADAVRSRK